MGFSSPSSGNGRAPLSEINVTPLVDVMLVLLIIFVVAAPMMASGVSVDLPNADAPTLNLDREQPVVAITTRKGNKGERQILIYLGDQKLELPELAARLLEDERIKKSSEVFLQADEEVPYGEVARVLSVIRRAGVKKIGLVTDPIGQAND